MHDHDPRYLWKICLTHFLKSSLSVGYLASSNVPTKFKQCVGGIGDAYNAPQPIAGWRRFTYHLLLFYWDLALKEPTFSTPKSG